MIGCRVISASLTPLLCMFSHILPVARCVMCWVWNLGKKLIRSKSTENFSQGPKAAFFLSYFINPCGEMWPIHPNYLSKVSNHLCGQWFSQWLKALYYLTCLFLGDQTWRNAISVHKGPRLLVLRCHCCLSHRHGKSSPSVWTWYVISSESPRCFRDQE